jgi:hypothetical protein
LFLDGHFELQTGCIVAGSTQKVRKLTHVANKSVKKECEMGLKVLKWLMFCAAMLCLIQVFGGGPQGGAAIGALGGGLWISFTMMYLYDRHLGERLEKGSD